MRWERSTTGLPKAGSTVSWQVRGHCSQPTGIDIPGMSEGEPNVTTDKIVKVHQGEMILPRDMAQAARDQMALGDSSGTAAFAAKTNLGFRGQSSGKSQAPNVTINVNVARASDSEAVRMAGMVKRYLGSDHELSGLGLGQVV